MNVLLCDPLKHQDKPHQASLEHEVAMAMQALRCAVAEISRLSWSAEARDAMIEHLGDLSAGALETSLVFQRVVAREAAE